MIDTHAHLERLCDIDKRISKVVLAAANLADSKNNLLLGEKYPDKLLVAVGVHPESYNDSPTELKKLIEENYKKIVAIGECGLDFLTAKDRDLAKEQEKIFRVQIELAQKYQLPLIVHARKAVDETLGILKEYKDLSGVIHCYSGGRKRIKKVMELGENWYFGIDGNLTYEEGLMDVVKNIPEDRLVLETDSPFLTPVPFRGEINNPSNVVYVYKKLAEIWGKSLEETEKIIDKNAKKLFKIV